MHIHRLCTARINEGETNASPSPPTLGCPNAMRHTLLLLTTETAGAEEGRRRPHRLADAPARTCKRAAGRSPGEGGRGGGKEGAGAAPRSHKTLCAKWPKDNEVCRAPLVAWVVACPGGGTAGFAFSLCIGEDEISVLVAGGEGNRTQPPHHTVAMMTNRWAMSLTLCSRSGAMRAMFSLENSHEGKMWITYAGC